MILFFFRILIIVIRDAWDILPRPWAESQERGKHLSTCSLPTLPSQLQKPHQLTFGAPALYLPGRKPEFQL